MKRSLFLETVSGGCQPSRIAVDSGGQQWSAGSGRCCRTLDLSVRDTGDCREAPSESHVGILFDLSDRAAELT